MTCGPPRRVCWKPVPTEHAAVHEDTGSCTGSTGRTNKNLGIGCFLADRIRNDDVGFWRREVACGETLRSGRKGRTLAPGSRYPNRSALAGGGYGPRLHGDSIEVADEYAEVFRGEGMAVLLYDHHGFGASGGQPQRQINAWLHASRYPRACD